MPDIVEVKQAYRESCTQAYHEATARCISLMECMRDLPGWPVEFWEYYAAASEYASDLEKRYASARSRMGDDNPHVQTIADEAQRFEIFDTYPVWKQACDEVSTSQRLGVKSHRVARLERLLSVRVIESVGGVE
jgi:hypothetical protein